MEYEAPHYAGHRKRLKERLTLGSPEAIPDYELLELLLFFAIPRKDVKPIAKRLLNNFGNIANLVNAEKDSLLEIDGATDSVYVVLSVMREMMNRVLKQKILKRNVISSWTALIDYLRVAMGSLKIEQFRVLFLNKKNILISDEVLSQGTVDEAAIYPRELIKRALYYDASALILVHNHPSGSSRPSQNDIEMTAKLAETCFSVNISLHDHVIVAGDEYFSFKSRMLI